MLKFNFKHLPEFVCFNWNVIGASTQAVFSRLGCNGYEHGEQVPSEPAVPSGQLVHSVSLGVFLCEPAGQDIHVCLESVETLSAGQALQGSVEIYCPNVPFGHNSHDNLSSVNR